MSLQQLFFFSISEGSEAQILGCYYKILRHFITYLNSFCCHTNDIKLCLEFLLYSMALFCWHKKQNEMAWWEGRWLTLKLIPVRTCYASQCQEGLPIGWVSKSLCVPANRSFMYIRLIYTPCIGVGVHWCVCVGGYLLRSDGGGCMLKPDIINAFYLQVLARRINTNANILRSPVPSLCWWLSWTWRVRNACVINALCCPLLMDVIEPRWLDIHTCLWTGQYYSIIRDWKVTYFVAFCCSACRKGMFIRNPVVGVRLSSLKKRSLRFFPGITAWCYFTPSHSW